MKSIITYFLLITTTIVFAQTPQAINYQAVAHDGSGNILSNRNVGLRISVLSGSATGTNVYSETFSTTTNASGIFSVEIGRGTYVSGNFPNIQWWSQPQFAKIEMDVNGGTNYQLVGTTQFLSVPYALFAENVAMLYTISCAPLTANDTATLQQGLGTTFNENGNTINWIGGEVENITISAAGFNSSIHPIGTSFPYTITPDQFENGNIGHGLGIKIDSLSTPGIYPITLTGTNSRGRQKSKTTYINILPCNVNSESDFVGVYIGTYIGGLIDTITIANPINGDGFLNLTFKVPGASLIATRNANTFYATFSNLTTTAGVYTYTNVSGTYRGVLCGNELKTAIKFSAGTSNLPFFSYNVIYTGTFTK